jgi:hypothetical protein
MMYINPRVADVAFAIAPLRSDLICDNKLPFIVVTNPTVAKKILARSYSNHNGRVLDSKITPICADNPA